MEQMSGARRSGRLLPVSRRSLGTTGGRVPLTQRAREVADAMEVTRHEEDSMETEQAE
jgi:hypothetical protein